MSVKALTHGYLIDGNGNDPISDATVVIDDDGRISTVGSNIDPPRDAEVIDASGRTIMPGLIDNHVHFFMQVGVSLQDEALKPMTFRAFETADRARRTLDAGCWHHKCQGRWLDATRIQDGRSTGSNRRATDEYRRNNSHSDWRSWRPPISGRHRPPDSGSAIEHARIAGVGC